MIAFALLMASTAMGNAAPAAPLPEASPTVIARAAMPATRPQTFAALLSKKPPVTGPRGWVSITHADAWAALASANARTRPAARWAYARSLVGEGRGQEARAVLEIMLASDGDLALVDTFQLAVGAARAEAGDARGALAVLADGTAGSSQLATNPEACAWRLWAYTMQGMPELANGQIACALPAINARSPATRAPFLYAGARSLLAAAHPAAVQPWLRALRDDDAGANLYRGRAALAIGDLSQARKRLKRVSTGSRQQQLDAEVSLLEADLAAGHATPAQIARVDHLALVWRGDAVEQRVLQLSYRIGVERRDLRRSLEAGAALVRYTRLGGKAAPLLADLQALLAAGLAPDSALPISEAAGLFWDYRDLAPTGAQGDFLANRLADRLQDRGLYLRAAELLRHQLQARAQDVAQGPLSARVASLYILAGLPTPALAAIHDTNGNNYPDEMQWERHRMEAVALYKLGRRAEALAALQDVPDGAAIRAEIYWKSRDWPALVAEGIPRVTAHEALSPVEQATIMRHAIALAMLGREPALRDLRTRYLAAFKLLPGAATIDLLTRDPGTLDGDALSAAMLAVPSVSPAGSIGDLLEVAVSEPRGPPAKKPVQRR